MTIRTNSIQPSIIFIPVSFFILFSFFYSLSIQAIGTNFEGRTHLAGIPTGVIRDIEVVGDIVYVASENGVFEVIGDKANKISFNQGTSQRGIISDIAYDSDGYLYIVEYAVGVFKVDLATQNVSRLFNNETWVTDAWSIELNQHYLAISAINRVFIASKETERLLPWVEPLTSVKFTDAYSLSFLNSDLLYVATLDKLIEIDLANRQIDFLKVEKEFPRLTALTTVTTHEGSVYVGGTEGFYIFEDKTLNKTFIDFEKVASHHSEIEHFFFTTSGETWVGAGSLFIVKENTLVTPSFMNPILGSESIRHITAIEETSNGDLVIASSQLGLFHISQVHRAINYLHHNENALRRNITSFGKDLKENFFFLTNENAFHLIEETGELIQSESILRKEATSCFSGEKNKQAFEVAYKKVDENYDFCELDLKDITPIDSHSFYVYVAKNNGAKYFLVRNGEIVDEFDAPQNIIYTTVLSTGEVASFDIFDNVYIQLSKFNWKKITPQQGGWQGIRCLVEFEQYYYVCTSGSGLKEIEKSTGMIKNSNLFEIPDLRFIRGALVSTNRNFWISTNMGLYVYSPRERLSYKIGKSSGILDTDFEYESFIDLRGKLVLLGDKYSYLIDEKRIIDALIARERNNIEVVLSRIDWVDKSDTEYVVFPTYDLNIPAFTDAFKSASFQLSLNEFQASDNKAIEFRIKGIVDTWITRSSSHASISISDIGHGSYMLEARAIGDSSTGKVNTFEFIIAPPVYLTSGAIIAYVFLLLTLVSLWRLGYLKPIKRFFKNTKIYQYVARYELTDGQSKFEKTLRAKEKHISTIAHDLRTPLQIILGSLEKAPDSANISSTEFAILRQNAVRIEKLVEQMSSTVPNMDASKSLFSRYSVEDVTRVVMNVEPLAKAKNQHLAVTCRGKQQICLISDSLEKIITNLVENAIKYTHEHGNIKVCATIDDKNLRITVTDDGEGIAASDHEKVLERFVRVHKGEVEGEGIGLSLVDDLVKLNQGKLTLSSVLGQGTKWTVILPLDDTESVNAEQVSNTEDKKWDDRHTIIVVDDNREFRTYMFNLLGKSYRCLIAKSGRQALELMDKYKVNLVITDLMMRGIDGIKLTEHIRGNEKFATTPVIILTAKTDEEAKRKALEEKADYYLTKPTPNNELLLLIEHLLSLRTLTAIEGADRPVLPQLGESLKIPEFTSEKDMNFYLNFIEVLEKNYHNEHFNREMAANLLLMSSRSLNRRLSELFDYNFSEFLTRFRIDKAVPLLLNGGSVITTGMDVGFGTPSYFSTSFKKIKGVSPKKFVDERKVGEQ